MAMHRFGAVLELAKQKKTPAQARKSLLEMGIITKAGALAEQYQAESDRSKAGGKSRRPKAVAKVNATTADARTKVS
jgi:hypothetical protein